MTPIDRVGETWLHASPRERGLLALAAVVVVGALGYAFVWQPLARDLAAGEVSVREARARAAWAQLALDEIAGLTRTAKPPRTADPRAAVERVVGAQGLRGALSSLDAQGGRIRVTFAAIDFEALTALVDVLGHEEQLFADEALLAARVEPGTVRAELALARPAAR